METRTILCAAIPTPEQVALLRETMLAFSAACNFISAVAFREGVSERRRLQKLTYYEVRARFALPAQLAIRAIAKVADAYKVSKAQQATFRPMGAVTYDCRVLRLLNRSQVSLTTLSGRITVPLNIGGYQRNRLCGALLGETDLLYNPDKKQWSLAFSVKTETLPVSDPPDFLGVDLGIQNIAADSDGTLFAGGKLRRMRKRARRLRRRLQKLGTRGSRRLLVKRRKKEQRRATHTNHVISKQIVAAAKGTGRGVAVEDLSGVRGRTTVRHERRAEHAGWAFHQLRFFLEYKCADAGIPCVAVDARNSSRTCPRCGSVDKRNRPTRDVFHCLTCALTGGADFFAACEIALRGRLVSRPNYPEWQPARNGAVVFQGKAPSPGRPMPPALAVG